MGDSVSQPIPLYFFQLMGSIKTILLELNQRPIAYYPVYVTITGGLTSGVLLSQIMYWYSVAKGEFYKTDAEIMDETKLTAAELRTAKARLKQLDFVHIRVGGIPAKTYYDINIENLIEAINETSLVESAKLEKRNQRNKQSEIQQTNTENTSKTTSKNTTNSVPENKFRGDVESVGEVAADFYENGEPEPVTIPADPTPPKLRATPPKAEKAPNQVYTLFEAYAKFYEAKGVPMSRNQSGSYFMPMKDANHIKLWTAWAKGMPNASGDLLADWQAYLDAAWQYGDKFIKGNFTPAVLYTQATKIVAAVNRQRIQQVELEMALESSDINDLLNP